MLGAESWSWRLWPTLKVQDIAKKTEQNVQFYLVGIGLVLLLPRCIQESREKILCQQFLLRGRQSWNMKISENSKQILLCLLQYFNLKCVLFYFLLFTHATSPQNKWFLSSTVFIILIRPSFWEAKTFWMSKEQNMNVSVFCFSILCGNKFSEIHHHH